MTAGVRTSGPFFNPGLRAHVMGQIIQTSQAAVGEHGVMLVRQQLDNVLVNPTGRYRSSISATNRTESTSIADSGIVYGPWLEGVGSRNRTTRFKGYATFRRVTGRLKVDGYRITAQIVGSLVRGLN